MLLITHDITDPYFNLASEEYFLREFDEEIIYLWRNDNAVIVGKHQNTAEEINGSFVADNNIKVVRRLTGGGAVFHDINNVNYSVILQNQRGMFSNYAFFTEPICKYLKSLGVEAELNGRNDITIDGRKFSGNAQAVVDDRILHHGTLLFRSDSSKLEGALKPSKIKIESKSVKSVRSRITNISEHLQGGSEYLQGDSYYPHGGMSTEEFMAGLLRYFEESVEGIRPYELTEGDIASIQALARSRYSTWEWNYGRSPKYSFSNQKRFDFGIVDVRLDVSGGTISEAHIFGDYFGTGDVAELEQTLEGIPHEKEAVYTALSSFDIDRYIRGMKIDELCKMLEQ